MVRGDSIEGAILATVAYFDVFAFAPSAKEIHRFLLGRRESRSEVESALRMSPRLEAALGEREGVFYLSGKEHLALRRPRFAKHASMLWPKAQHIARFIRATNLASCGLVTGSLAADNADEHADVDFLFIYPAARTWSSYALVRILQKLPLLGLSELCPNYALADDALTVKPQNLFTAWEIAKAVPMFGFDVYRRFAGANRWVKRLLPNALPVLDAPDGVEAPPPPRPDLPRLFSFIESMERRRKFSTDRRDVGVDMEARARTGSTDRHSPTRSSYALAELSYRMSALHLEAHPLFPEIVESHRALAREMGSWAGEQIDPASS